MKYPNRLEAEELLKWAHSLNPGPWEKHSRNAARAAQTIAGACGMDADKAYVLALLDDPSIPHPPLEVIITVDEETGMYGAAGIDLSMLKGKKLINLDSEDEGVFTVSCAGGCRATIALNVERRAVYGPCIRLAVDGLQGGHSGAEIHKNRANANKVMGEFLRRIQEKMPLCLASLSGGSKDNAITRSCSATLVAMGSHIERINDVAEALQAEIRDKFDEPEAMVYGEDVDALGGNALSTQDTAKVIALLCTVPNGVQVWSKDIEGLVQTSLNMGIAKLTNQMKMTFSVRSSVNAEKVELLEKLTAYFGRQPELPEWVYNGLIVGVQGGNERSFGLVDKSIDNGIKVAAVTDKTGPIVAVHTLDPLAKEVIMMSHLSRMIDAMKRADMEAVIVTSEINQRYLTGFAFTDGAVMVGAEETLLLTDSRYIESAENGIQGFEVLEMNRENNYIKRLNDLEQLAMSYPGVTKTYAIQAGRELRVIVGADKIDDKQTECLSADIAKKIQDEMTYPGQVKITVIRETRAVSFAK